MAGYQPGMMAGAVCKRRLPLASESLNLLLPAHPCKAGLLRAGCSQLPQFLASRKSDANQHAAHMLIILLLAVLAGRAACAAEGGELLPPQCAAAPITNVSFLGPALSVQAGELLLST